MLIAMVVFAVVMMPTFITVVSAMASGIVPISMAGYEMAAVGAPTLFTILGAYFPALGSAGAFANIITQVKIGMQIR